MSILGPDGRPAHNVKKLDPDLPYGQGGTKAGHIVCRRDAKGWLAPMGDANGNLMLIWDPQGALKAAQQAADQELRPTADQKVVKPLQESAVYMILQCNVLGEVQAKLKDPQQLLAPGGKLDG